MLLKECFLNVINWVWTVRTVTSEGNSSPTASCCDWPMPPFHQPVMKVHSVLVVREDSVGQKSSYPQLLTVQRHMLPHHDIKTAVCVCVCVCNYQRHCEKQLEEQESWTRLLIWILIFFFYLKVMLLMLNQMIFSVFKCVRGFWQEVCLNFFLSEFCF